MYFLQTWRTSGQYMPCTRTMLSGQVDWASGSTATAVGATAASGGELILRGSEPSSPSAWGCAPGLPGSRPQLIRLIAPSSRAVATGRTQNHAHVEWLSRQAEMPHRSPRTGAVVSLKFCSFSEL